MTCCPFCHSDGLKPLFLAYERVHDWTKPMPEDSITRKLLRCMNNEASLSLKMAPPSKVHPLAHFGVVSLVLLFLDKTIPFYFEPFSVSTKLLVSISLAGLYTGMLIRHYYRYKYQLKAWYQSSWCEQCQRRI